MEPIFRGDEVEGFGHHGRPAGIPEQYRGQSRQRVVDSMEIARRSPTGALGCRGEISYQLGARNARGDFPPGRRIGRMASVTQAQDSNDDDGETSSASEDSVASAGYPSPQVRLGCPAKRAEPCASIHLPPAQRARLQPKETEPALHAGWSPPKSSSVLREDTKRQLPRLAALEAAPRHSQQKPTQLPLPIQQTQEQHPASHKHPVQHARASSGSSSIAPQMQLPSLIGSGRSTVLPASAVTSAHSAPSLKAAEGARSAGQHPSSVFCRAPPPQQKQHHRGEPSPTHAPVTPQSHPRGSYEAWSQADARAVPRLEGLSGRMMERPLPAVAPVPSLADSLRGQRQWGSTWASGHAPARVPIPSTSFASQSRYNRPHENGWVTQQDATVASSAFGWAEAGRRQEVPPATWSPSRQGETFQQQHHRHHRQQQQEREARQHLLPSPQPKHQQQHQAAEPHFPAQAMQPHPQIPSGRGVSRTPSPVYRTATPQSSPQEQRRQRQEQLQEQEREQEQRVASRNMERKRSGTLAPGERGGASPGGEWATGSPRPESQQAGKQILQRYLKHLNPKASREVWSHDEEEVLWRAHHEYGNEWSYIAELLPGRSENAVKNHWYTRLREFIGPKNTGPGKGSTPDGSVETSGACGSSASSTFSKMPHQCAPPQKRQEPKAAEESNARRRTESPEPAFDTKAPEPKAAARSDQMEEEARAEAVAALGMLFSQSDRMSPPLAGSRGETAPQTRQPRPSPVDAVGSRERLATFNAAGRRLA